MVLKLCEAIFTSVNNTDAYPQEKYMLTAANELEKIDMQALTKNISNADEIADKIKQTQLAVLDDLIKS